jgi:hypothetical protein
MRTMKTAAAMLLLAALAVPAASPATALRYRFARPPIVALEYNSDGDVQLGTYVKLNHQLPRSGNGGLGSTALWVADVGGSDPTGTLGRRASRCYAAEVDPSFTDSKVLKHPRAGDLVRVRVWIGTRVVADTHVRLSRSLNPRGTFRDGPYAKALGC